jgi:hypothetical protein
VGLTVALSVAVRVNSAAASSKDVGLYLNFAHGFKATIAGGDPVPVKIIGHPRIVAGPQGGKAVELRNGRDALVYKLKGNLNPRQGTISLWLSPVNWDGSNGNALQVLMHTNGGRKAQQLVVQTFYPFGDLLLAWYNHGHLISGFPTGIGCTAPLRMARDLASVLGPGKWYNYIITWRKGYDAMYLNGQRRGVVRDSAIFLRHLGNRIYLGWDKKIARAYWEPYTGVKARPLAAKPWKSLLAKVTVLKSFVLAEQAKKIYQMGARRWALASRGRHLAIYAKFYQTASILAVNVVMPGRGPRLGRIVVKNAAGKTVAQQAFALSGKKVQTKATVHFSDLPVGRYYVSGIAQTGFHTPALSFKKVHPRWMGNKLGDKDVVLWPWTPIRLTATPHGPTVSLWGRAYDFFGGPLPTSMVSRGQELLSGPVHWVLGKSTVVFGPAQVVSHGPARVVLRSVGHAGPYRVVATTRVDYDGFLWSSFAFAAGHKEQIGPLKVRVPINAQHSLFMQYDTRRSNAFPTRRWSHPFMPYLAYIFVGGTSAGLEWFAQSDQYWHNADPNKQMEVLPVTGGGGRIVMNVIGQTATMPRHFTIAFGLMGTPVRAMPRGWRGWSNSPPDRYRQGIGRPWRCLQLDYSWWSVSPAWLVPGPGILQKPFEPGRYRAWCPFTSTDFCGIRAFAQKNPRKLMPLWKEFAPEWGIVPESGQIGSAPGWATENVNPSPSFVDHYVWQLNKFLAHYPAAGIYIDGDAGNMPSSNRMAGFGYDAGHGRVKPTYPILAARRMARRMYAVMLDHRGRNGIIWVHRSTCLLMPVQSFCNVTLDGEFMGWTDILHKMVTHGIRAALTDNLLRCTFSNRMFGQVPMMDSRYVDWVLNNKSFPNGGIASVRVQNARMVMGLFMLNDIWGWGDIGGYSGIFMPAVDWWNIAAKDVRFLPWWRKNPAANAGWATRCSVYLKPDLGKALVVVLNNSGYARTLGSIKGQVKVKLNLAALGLKENGFKAYNAESLGTLPIPVDGNVIALNIGPYGVRLIALVRNH